MTSVSQEQVSQQLDNGALQRWARRWLPKKWYVHLVLTVSILVMGFPVFYAVIVATQTNTEVYAYQLTPGNALTSNWDVVVNQRHLFDFMLSSIIVALCMTTLKVVLSLTSGLALVYFRFPGKWLVLGFILLTLMMRLEVMAIALFRVVSGTLHLGNTYAGMILPFIASATGTFLFRQHFSNVPAELSEAAQLDGASPIRFLFTVLIPMSWNTISALFVIMFLFAWNQYLWPLMIIQDPSLKPVQMGLRSLLGMFEAEDTFGPLMLGTILASIPPVIVFVMLQERFMSGFGLTREK